MAALALAWAVSAQTMDSSHAMLEDVLQQSSAGRESALAEELAKLSPDAFPRLLELLATCPAWLEPAEEELLVARLAAGGAELRKLLDRLAGTSVALGERRAALRILGAGGDTSDLRRLARFAVSTPDAARAERDMLRAFGAALARILRRSQDHAPDLRSLFRDAHPSILAVIAREAANLGTIEAWEALAQALGVQRAADPILIVELGRLGELLGPPLPGQSLQDLRAYLEDADPRMCRLAIDAVARLGDLEAVPKLVELCAHEQTRAASDRALRRLTGHNANGDPDAWARYLTAEEAWWEGEGVQALDGLRSADAAVVTAAIRALVRHPLYKTEIAPGLLGLLERPEPEILRCAAAALGVLGGAGAFEALVGSLRHPDPEVSRSVREALSRIVGLAAASEGSTSAFSRIPGSRRALPSTRER